ncbi:hypothetical protein ACK2F5_01595 [Clostridioides difficile]
MSTGGKSPSLSSKIKKKLKRDILKIMRSI